MILGCLECKDNNAAYVKRITPEALLEPPRQQLQLRISDRIKTDHEAQKELDIAADESIIIFTYIERRSPP